ncbi:hypothetical protein GGS23DRAFT_562122 [Durotheca rogersii]|uniref:uncharacterized protein n=1 Tax=Durotheca rogersii TaxID=419775 RepID=UPI00221ECED2|nr:uncharacterized protein GGS23DRAFT_562122 [Durotheca rogersii]KAI5864848.1 hypothetical protein GGS23DRAFT_562122 [Durotheca rogersii]
MRRAVSAASQSPLLSSLTPASARAPAVFSLICDPCCQQSRRYSSSKPSSPKDSPKGDSDGQVTATASQTKQPGEKRRRKNKEWTDLQSRLPSVPSTQHVPQEALALSTFFSLHRPMSVTHSFPKTITEDAFAQIFAPRSKSNKCNDVVSTLSRSVDELEQPMQNMSLESQSSGETGVDARGQPMHKMDLKHPDGTESSVYVQLDAMSGQFLPFRPPPLPQPGNAASPEAGTATATAKSVEEAPQHVPQHRVYKAMFTLEETTDERGQVRIVAHSPKLVEEPPTPRSFLERMALRHLRFRDEPRNQGVDMVAISVKRQRKLKMKKKKYKKLMKRTRNLRRKLDRV